MRAERKYQRSLLMGSTSLVIALALSQTAFAEKANPTSDELAQVTQTADQAAQGTADQANAVEEEEDEVEELIVTGFRASLSNAISNKRRSDIIIESVTAEDIGRLPDVSIAEALARLPGIASQRTDGQASAINIRGLAQNLVFATLNGREQVTQNGNRSIEFDQYPSELLAGADVYKSPKASLIEGGIAGTVELKTLRPLDRDKRTFTFNVRGSYNDRANEIVDANPLAYRLSASYVDQFANNTIGVAIGYARFIQPDVSTRFVGFDYDNFRPRDFNGDRLTDNASFGFEAEQQGGINRRDGVFASYQWKPSKIFEWTTDFFYSRFTTESFGRGVRVTGTQAVNFGNPNTIVTNPIVTGRALTGGTFTRNIGAPTLARGGFGLTFAGINDNQEDRNNLYTVGSKLKFDFERLKFSGDFTYSRAASDFANEVSALLPIVAQNAPVTSGDGDFRTAPVLSDQAQVTIRLRGVDLPTLNFREDFTNRSLFRLARFGVFPFSNRDRLFAFRGDAEYKVGGFIPKIEAGFRYSTRDATQSRVSADFGNDAGFFQFGQSQLAPITVTDANSSIQCFRGAFATAGFPCFTVVNDPRALVEAQVGRIVPNQSQGFTRNESFIVSENVIAGYAQADLDARLFGVELLGNVGLRVVHTNQSSFNQEVANVTGRGSVGRSYTQFLPSANFNFQVTDQDVLRFAGSRAISRAPIGQLGGGVGVGFSVANNRIEGGGGGNAGLLPYMATQGDISYEHYFGKTGIFTFALFYKALDSFIVSQNDDNFDFAAAGLVPLLSQTDAALSNAAQAGSRPPGFIGRFGGPVNGQGGYVRGLEIAATGNATFLPAPLDGLGATISYSYTGSQINFVASNSGESLVLPLPGLSNHVVNTTVFYELGGFSNRAGIRYRTRFISPQVGINQQLPFTNSELVLDYQASYEFPDTSPLKGLTLLVQANNLTDTPVRTYFGSVAQTGTLQFFGRQFYFGASYTF